MNTIRQFKLPETLEHDLQNTGTYLIEASAGTGKTYTIERLFLWLVVERQMEVKQILVVTFTEAATEELKGRIRALLRKGIDILDGQKGDSFFDALLGRHSSGEARNRLLDALRDFDEAAIFTIHGFCMRTLQESAFESGSLFDTELVPDQKPILQETVEDFWRTHFYDASPMFVAYLIATVKHPRHLTDIVGNRISHPDIRVLPPTPMPERTEELEKAFADACAAVRTAWPEAKAEVKGLLCENPALNKARYKPASVIQWMDSMEAYLAAETPSPVLFDKFHKFTSQEITSAAKKGKTAPAHPFFDLCGNLLAAHDELKTAYDTSVMAYKIQLFDEVIRSLKQRKTANNIQSFDDLLLDLRAALRRPGGEILIRNIRNKYQAALIDEFQDTDPVQYEIFKTLFDADTHLLFLIGDPKQAIYGFRGADIFAYMEAARLSPNRYTLTHNWRSEPNLIQAVNTVFSAHPCPFVYEEIPFLPVAVPDERPPGQVSLTLDGASPPPLQIWTITPEDDAKPVNKGEAREQIIRAVSAEIVRLLQMGREKKAMLGDRPLRPGDIAVLVRENAEANMMKAALSDCHVPSVLHSTGDVFDTHEAEEMEYLLSAIANAGEEMRVRTALTTDMLGVSGEMLDVLTRDDLQWEARLIDFADYRRLWETHGFIRMFRRLLEKEKVLPRLMALNDGERRCTNVLHLGELLHQADVRRKIGMAGLVKWLVEQRHSAEQRTEEHPLRLESDENAIRLVTMHKSKGLEYPVVFCPFTWSSPKSGPPVIFHDESDQRRLTLDLGSDQVQVHDRLAQKEQLAENLRLMYVALTRARNRCYLVWGRMNTAEASAPAYLFHTPDADPDDVVAAVKKRFSSLKNSPDLLGELNEVLAGPGSAIGITPLPEAPKRSYVPDTDPAFSIACRHFPKAVSNEFQVSSFSSLVSGRRYSAEIADYDATISRAGTPLQTDSADGLPSPERAEYTIFTFPKGARAGNCLHNIFEVLDFTETDRETIAALVTEHLQRYRFEEEWSETITDMVQKVLSSPLDPRRNRQLTLSRVKPSDRLNELEFYFPLRIISPPLIRTLFLNYGAADMPDNVPDRIGSLGFSRMKGYMKGFIDLVFQYDGRFYLVDWKSNWLGDRVTDYGPGALQRTMETELYVLQYHIYTLALHQYLTARLPGYRYADHFGGVYYLFLRGIDPVTGPDYGIFRDRPSEQFVDALQESMILTQ